MLPCGLCLRCCLQAAKHTTPNMSRMMYQKSMCAPIGLLECPAMVLLVVVETTWFPPRYLGLPNYESAVADRMSIPRRRDIWGHRREGSTLGQLSRAPPTVARYDPHGTRQMVRGEQTVHMKIARMLCAVIGHRCRCGALSGIPDPRPDPGMRETIPVLSDAMRSQVVRCNTRGSRP